MTKKYLHLYAILLQIIDGVFTYWGVIAFGIGPEIEGNPIIKYLIEVLGPFMALSMTKVGAIIVLVKFKKIFNKLALGILCFFYTLAMLLWIFGFMKLYELL